MANGASSSRLPQVSSVVAALKESEGLKLKDVFSGDQISAAIAKTVPDFRGRVFPP